MASIAADMPATGASADPESHKRPAPPSRWRAPVRPAHVAAVPLACAFVSGLVDSTMFNAFSTFVAMQTGNTIFLALGASGQDATRFAWAKSLLAVGCFAAGSFLFARLPGAVGFPARSRLALAASFAAQAALTLAAAALAQSGAVAASVPAHPWAPAQLAPIALLAVQSAGQIVAARALGVGEVPTVVVTSLLCDLFSDPALWQRKNPKRDRRAAAFVLTLVGAVIGGWVSRETRGVAASLWAAGGIKVAIVVAWCVWPAEEGGGKG